MFLGSENYIDEESFESEEKSYERTITIEPKRSVTVKGFIFTANPLFVQSCIGQILYRSCVGVFILLFTNKATNDSDW